MEILVDGCGDSGLERAGRGFGDGVMDFIIVFRNAFNAVIGLAPKKKIILAVLLGVLAVWLIFGKMPSSVLGIPSLYWATPGSKVVTREGHIVKYLTESEIEAGTVYGVNIAEPLIPYRFKMSDFYSQDETFCPGVVCRVKVLETKDFIFYRKQQEAPGYMQQQTSAWVKLYLEEIVFDPREKPLEQGQTLWVYSPNSRMEKIDIVIEKDARFYVVMLPSEQYFKQEALYENGEAIRSLVTSHTDYTVHQFHGYRWPILDDEVYTPVGLIRSTGGTQNIRGSAYYPVDEESFANTIKDKFDTVRAKWESDSLKWIW